MRDFFFVLFGYEEVSFTAPPREKRKNLPCFTRNGGAIRRGIFVFDIVFLGGKIRICACARAVFGAGVRKAKSCRHCTFVRDSGVRIYKVLVATSLSCRAVRRVLRFVFRLLENQKKRADRRRDNLRGRVRAPRGDMHACFRRGRMDVLCDRGDVRDFIALCDKRRLCYTNSGV